MRTVKEIDDMFVLIALWKKEYYLMVYPIMLLTIRTICRQCGYLDGKFSCYYSSGSSALKDIVSSGPLYGRPFGETYYLCLTGVPSNCIYASERFVIIKVGDLICINVYYPCKGTLINN